MENPRLGLRVSVLESFFDKTTKLLTYLSNILEPTEEPFEVISQHILQPNNSPTFEAFMNTTYVSTTGMVPRAFKVYKPMMNMHDVSVLLYTM